MFSVSSTVRGLISGVGHWAHDMNQVLILLGEALPIWCSEKKPASPVSFCIKQLNINGVRDRGGEFYPAVYCSAHLTGNRNR